MPNKTKGFLVVAVIACTLLALPYPAMAQEWTSEKNLRIVTESVPVFAEPDDTAKSLFTLYKGTELEPTAEEIIENQIWFQFQAGSKKYWLKGFEKTGGNIVLTQKEDKRIVDSYGILNQPHRYAVKLVKYPDAKGHLETYEKIGSHYRIRNVYYVSYRQKGPKTHYSDLKSVGGPVIRYMYRTTRSGMNSVDKNGEKFGVYKISYPMPHDALPYLLDGQIGPSYYNNIPVLNEKNGVYSPHPHSLMGADILIHTARWGSRGCINVDNEEMAYLYKEDLATENDREIIPLVIYDEDMDAPRIGKLF